MYNTALHFCLTKMSVHECSGYCRNMSTQEDGYYMNKGSLRYPRINNA
jgi:hypothetical protein